MSKWDKLLFKVSTLSSDIRFSELKKILESYGYKDSTPKTGSSHHTFRKQGKYPITIPKSQKIKTIYIKQVQRIIEEENHE